MPYLLCHMLAKHCCSLIYRTLMWKSGSDLTLKTYPCWNKTLLGLNIFYFTYMKRDWAEHRCYVEAPPKNITYLLHPSDRSPYSLTVTLYDCPGDKPSIVPSTTHSSLSSCTSLVTPCTLPCDIMATAAPRPAIPESHKHYR